MFTHFALTLTVLVAEVDAVAEAVDWRAPDVATEGLPTVFRKALEAGLGRLA